MEQYKCDMKTVSRSLHAQVEPLKESHSPVFVKNTSSHSHTKTNKLSSSTSTSIKKTPTRTPKKKSLMKTMSAAKKKAKPKPKPKTNPTEKDIDLIIDIATCSEKTVMGNDTFDGIEVSMKQNGMMEVVHVMSSPTSLKDRDNAAIDDDEKSASSLPISAKDDETVLSSPTSLFGDEDQTTSVNVSRMSMRYHPLCDSLVKHRIPIKSNKITRTSFKDKLTMLRGYLVRSEEHTAQSELLNLWTEMKAIEKDRQQELQSECSVSDCTQTWDIDSYLDGVSFKQDKAINASKCFVDKDQCRALQQRRGAFVHVGFKNVQLLQNFARKCGGNPKSCEPNKALEDCNLEMFGINLISSQATTVRHFAIAKRSANKAAYFISKDDGRNHSEGCIPKRLAKRLKEEIPDDQQNIIMNSIRYLSLGPNKSYCASLVSGQTLWGIGYGDLDFQDIMDTFDVHRVVFGSFEQGASWIVLSKDGRIAWRNIPCRLHNLLKNRGFNQVRSYFATLEIMHQCTVRLIKLTS